MKFKFWSNVANIFACSVVVTKAVIYVLNTVIKCFDIPNCIQMQYLSATVLVENCLKRQLGIKSEIHIELRRADMCLLSSCLNTLKSQEAKLAVVRDNVSRIVYV